MKKITVLFISIAIVTAFSSCEKIAGKGPIVTETRTATNFTSIESSISANVNYKQAPEYKVEISAQQNILDVIQTNMSGSELVIKFKNGVRVKSGEAITVNVTSPTIEAFSLSGSGNLIASDSIHCDNLNFTLSGSGNIHLQSLTANSFDANISGSGNVLIESGILNTGNFKISGSGSIDVSNVPATSITTNTSGSGEMKVNALADLDITISGSGSVYYTGNPQIKTHISGSGKVIQQ